MQNVPSILDVEFFSDDELERLPLDQLGAIYGEAKDVAAKVAKNKRRLTQAISRRFADELENVTTGTTTIVRGDVELKVTTPKKIEWDQDVLAGLEEKIRSDWKEDPSEYLITKRSVSETAYKGWPHILQRHFEPARTVKPGSITLEFRDLKNRGGE